MKAEIKAKDFRVGNLVEVAIKQPRGIPDTYQKGKVISLNEYEAVVYGLMIGEFGTSYCHITTRYKNIQPIPLTPEILIKAGFASEKNGWYSIKYFSSEDADDVNLVNYNVDSNRCNITTVDSSSGGGYSRDIKYLHELQNLYYALNGTELTIDL